MTIFEKFENLNDFIHSYISILSSRNPRFPESCDLIGSNLRVTVRTDQVVFCGSKQHRRQRLKPWSKSLRNETQVYTIGPEPEPIQEVNLKSVLLLWADCVIIKIRRLIENRVP